MPYRVRPSLIAFAAPALALVALAAAVSAPPTTTAFMPGRTFGIGEQQVYSIEQDTKLIVRFRRADGSIDARNIESNTKRSVAFTVEGLTSAGNPVLGVATAVATPAPSGGSENAPAQGTAQPSASASVSPPPSPDVAADGSVRVDGDLAGLAPLGGVLAGAAADKLDPRTTWRSEAAVKLPLVALALHMSNTANAPANPDENTGVIGVTSTGSVDVSGSPKISGYGATRLRGSGAAAVQAFLDQKRGVVLGMLLNVGSRGNAASAHGDHGEYELNVQYSVRLVRYVAGAPIQASPSPGAQPTLDTLTRFASPSSVFSNGSLNPLARPAPTDPIFRATPFPGPTETATPAPSESLPPVPIPQSSDAPIASPPPPPTASPGT
jgi:hypothetical protein